jgi:hypothetical protein
MRLLTFESAWEKQQLNYLRATDIEVGMLFKFGARAEFERYLFDNDKKIRVNPCASVEKKLPEREMP